MSVLTCEERRKRKRKHEEANPPSPTIMAQLQMISIFSILWLDDQRFNAKVFIYGLTGSPWEVICQIKNLSVSPESGTRSHNTHTSPGAMLWTLLILLHQLFSTHLLPTNCMWDSSSFCIINICQRNYRWTDTVLTFWRMKVQDMLPSYLCMVHVAVSCCVSSCL